jgi:anaerobic C4-dicarboxylate transporter
MLSPVSGKIHKRLETDEEFKNRLDREEAEKKLQQEKELSEFERLSKKFGC